MPQPDDRDSVIEGSEPPSAELLAKAGELIANVELVNVRPCDIQASIEAGVAPGAVVSLVKMETALSYAAQEGVYGNRIDFRFELLGEAADLKLGQVSFSLLVDYDVTEGFTPDEAAAEFVTGTTGYFAAYPYARELFTSLAVRLQFDPVVIGLLKRGSLRPGSINVVRCLGDPVDEPA